MASKWIFSVVFFCSSPIYYWTFTIQGTHSHFDFNIKVVKTVNRFFFAMCADYTIWKEKIEMVLMLLFPCPRFFRSHLFRFAIRAGVYSYNTHTLRMVGSNWKTKNWYKRVVSWHRYVCVCVFSGHWMVVRVDGINDIQASKWAGNGKVWSKSE